MNPKEIIEQCTENGLTLTVTEDGNLDVVGSQDWIDIWSSILRENKKAILAELTGNALCNVSVTPEVTQADQRKENNGCSSIVSKTSQENSELDIDCLQVPYKPLASPFETLPVTPDANALQSHSGKYSITVTDSSTDPVLVDLNIAGCASFTMEIPKQFYNGMALLELLEKYNKTQSVMSGLSQETHGIDRRAA